MAQKKKRSLVDRLMLGSEKSEGYARAQLPSNRWELFWDIFKGRFWKIVIINLLMMLFLIPVAALLFFRHVAILNYGTIYPFNQCFGVGYQAAPSLVGYAESIIFNVDLVMYLALPIVLSVAAVGLAGGAYVIRNMIWTEGIFVANDFWRGIKQNFRPVISVMLSFSLVFYVTMVSASMSAEAMVINPDKKWLFVISQVLSYVILGIYISMTLHMLTMCVTYELKFKELLKNSLLFTVGLLPQNIFFVFLGLIPFIVCLIGGFFTGIGIMMVLLFGFSMFLLIWSDFCHWAYDKFINDKIPGAQKNRGIYEKVKETDSAAIKQYREQVALATRSALNSKPIKPITDDELQIAELPTSFNRGDIEKLNASKQAIYDDHARYVEEHKNDPQYVVSEEEQKAIETDKSEREKRIEAAKKELAKRNKKK